MESAKYAEPIILDDVHTALSRLTELGKTVVGPPAKAVREAILVHAAIRGWTVLQHGAFATWAEAQLDPDLLWAVLDPLLLVRKTEIRTVPIRLTRVAMENEWKFDGALSPEIVAVIHGSLVGILDDAVDSGRTLRHAASLIAQAGGEVDDIIVATSTEAARTSVGGLSPCWAQFRDGNYSATHLRDACPFLPFAGRRTSDKASLKTDRGAIDVRVPAVAFKGGLWRELLSDRTVRQSMLAARRIVAERFACELGRPATVSDIPLLGADIGLPLLPWQSASPETMLDTILR